MTFASARLGSPIRECLATQNGLHRKARQLYFGRIGYVAQPKADKRGEFFVRAEVLESAHGICSLHLPNSAVRDYFYFFTPTPPGQRPPTLYEVLRTRATATPADLRLSYRICRLEHETESAANPEVRSAERAFNLLAHPDLRSCYDGLLQNLDAPAVFPYGGFGQCVVSGELAEDGATFFVRRLLSYLPDQRRQFRAPLRRIEYRCCALYRDSRRKAEVHISSFRRVGDLEPVEAPGADEDWRHGNFLLSPANTETRTANGIMVSGRPLCPVACGWRCRPQKAGCRSQFNVFGEYHDADRAGLNASSAGTVGSNGTGRPLPPPGIPPDFDIAQFCWKPDYVLLLPTTKNAADNVYLFRDEYIFDCGRDCRRSPSTGARHLHLCQAGDVREFVHKYAPSRDNIREPGQRGTTTGLHRSVMQAVTRDVGSVICVRGSAKRRTIRFRFHDDAGRISPCQSLS